MGISENNNQNKVGNILSQVKDLSSKFSEVGRSIVFAVIAGCWVIYNKFPGSPKIWLKLSILFSFLYLGIELWYYGSTMRKYYKFLTFDDENTSVEVSDEKKTFVDQHKLHCRFFNLVYVKMVLLLLSIATLILFVFFFFFTQIINYLIQIRK